MVTYKIYLLNGIKKYDFSELRIKIELFYYLAFPG